jgi:hypothetical protein
VDELPVGSGQLDLTAYLRGNLLQARGGIQADYDHRVAKNVSVFGQGWLGTTWAQDTGTTADYGVLGGLRWRF